MNSANQGAAGITHYKTEGLLDDYTLPLVPLKTLRVVEMSGFDYIFAPVWICEKYTTRKAIQDFLLNAQAVFVTELDRTILVQYEQVSDGNFSFQKYSLEWAGEMLMSCYKESIDQTPQFEFMKTLLEHSELLVN